MRNKLITKTQLTVSILIFFLLFISIPSLNHYAKFHTWPHADLPPHGFFQQLIANSNSFFTPMYLVIKKLAYSQALLTLHVFSAITLFLLYSFQILTISFNLVQRVLHRVIGKIILYIAAPLFAIFLCVFVGFTFANSAFDLSMRLFQGALCLVCIYLANYYAKKRQFDLHVSFMLNGYVVLASALFVLIVVVASTLIAGKTANWYFMNTIAYLTQFLVYVILVVSKKSKPIEYAVPVIFLLAFVAIIAFFFQHPYEALILP